MKAVSEIVDGVSTNLLFFDSRRSLEAFVEEQKQSNGVNRERFSINDTRRQADFDSDWYGTPVAKSFEDIKNHSNFLGRELYQSQKNKLSSMLRKSESLGQMQDVPSKKLKFNDLGLGVFCFPRAAVALRKHKRPDKTIKIVSDVRDVYAYFPNVENSVKTISLYQFIGGNANVTANELQYCGIATMAISEYLIENGYDVEINLIIGSFSNSVVCSSCVKVKSVSDELNINDLMLLSSDPRWFRYKGFKNIIANFNYFGERIDSQLGRIDTIVPYCVKLIEKHRQTDVLPIILKHTYSEAAVLQEVNRVLGIVKNS
jgi:hypothetical protein